MEDNLLQEIAHTRLEGIHDAVILFPDYDSLRSGTAKELYDRERVVQEYFEEAAHITGLNVTRLLFNASESELRSLPDAYPLLFLLQAAAVGYLRARSIDITHVGGYGLGAYGALYAAGAYTFADGLYLVSKWANAYNELLQEKSFKKISLTGITYNKLKKSLAYDQLMVSEKISQTTFVIAGMRAAVEEWEETLAQSHADVLIIELPLEGGIYADLASEKTINFKQYLEKVEFKDAQLTCFSPAVSADLVTAQQIKEFMSEQPFLYQDREQLLERYAPFTTLIAPWADDALLNQLHARYPQKNIITLR